MGVWGVKPSPIKWGVWGKAPKFRKEFIYMLCLYIYLMDWLRLGLDIWVVR